MTENIHEVFLQDDRSIYDFTASEIETKQTEIRTTILSNYRYTYYPATIRNERNYKSTHVLQLTGIFSYIPPLHAHVDNTLYTLPLEYPDSPIPKDILESALISEFNTFTFPDVPDQYRTSAYKLNFMVATTMLANNRKCELSKLIGRIPELLVYKAESGPFEEIFKYLQPVRILQVNTNYFNTVDTRYSNWMNLKTKEQIKNFIDQFPPTIRATMHSTFTFNTFHYFTYSTIEAYYEHICARIFEDWAQFTDILNGRVVTVKRVCERLYILDNDEKANNLTIYAALYPIERERTPITDPLNANRWLVNMMNTFIESVPDQYKEIFNLLTAEKIRAFIFNDIHDMLHKQLNINVSILPNITIEYELDRQRPHVADGVGKIIRLMDVYGDFYILRTVRPTKLIQSSMIKVSQYLHNLNSISDIFQYVLYSPTLNKWDEQDENTDKTAHEVFNDIGYSTLISSLNNLDGARYSQIIKLFQRSYAQAVFNDSIIVNAGGIEHLVLVACTTSKLAQTASGRIVFANTDPPVIRPINNSTFKLLSCFKFLIDLGADATPTTNYLNSSASITFYGAITEPMIPLLKQFYTGQKSTISGYGLDAIGPNIRVDLTSPISVNRNYDLTISDMNQSQFDTPDDQFNEVLKQYAATIITSPISFFKLNHPTTYIMNKLIQWLNKKFENTSTKITLYVLNWATQNLMTPEIFLYTVKRPGNFEHLKYFSDTAPFIHKYLTSSFRVIKLLDDIEILPDKLLNLNSRIATELTMTPNKEEVLLYNCESEDASCGFYLAQFQQIAIKVSHWKISQISKTLHYSTRSNIHRMYQQSRNDERDIPSSLIQFLLDYPANLGIQLSKATESMFVPSMATLINKMSVYERIHTRLTTKYSQNEFINTYSIGGRYGEDFLAVRSLDATYTIIDPVAIPDDKLSDTYNWKVEQRVYDYKEIIKDDSIYLFLFVIMTYASGQPISSTDQLINIIDIAGASLKTLNSVQYIVYYDSDIISSIMTSNNGQFSIVERQIAAGDYAPVSGISKQLVDSTLKDLNVQFTYLDWNQNELAHLMLKHLIMPTPMSAMLLPIVMSIVKVVELSGVQVSR